MLRRTLETARALPLRRWDVVFICSTPISRQMRRFAPFRVRRASGGDVRIAFSGAFFPRGKAARMRSNRTRGAALVTHFMACVLHVRLSLLPRHRTGCAPPRVAAGASRARSCIFSSTRTQEDDGNMLGTPCTRIGVSPLLYGCASVHQRAACRVPRLKDT